MLVRDLIDVCIGVKERLNRSSRSLGDMNKQNSTLVVDHGTCSSFANFSIVVVCLEVLVLTPVGSCTNTFLAVSAHSLVEDEAAKADFISGDALDTACSMVI